MKVGIGKGKEMVIKNDSLTLVLAGDWNKYYLQPAWFASNVLEQDEVEVGVNGVGVDLTASYRSNGVVIVPNQSKMSFSAMNRERGTIDYLCRCANNFIREAHTPNFSAYGFNIDFQEEDGDNFAQILDGMDDTRVITDNGYEIITTKISRTLQIDDKIINMDSTLNNGGTLLIHFNEHHNLQNNTQLEISYDNVESFLNDCTRIVKGLGYQMEDDE